MMLAATDIGHANTARGSLVHLDHVIGFGHSDLIPLGLSALADRRQHTDAGSMLYNSRISLKAEVADQQLHKEFRAVLKQRNPGAARIGLSERQNTAPAMAGH
jgi:hypothetical protein